MSKKTKKSKVKINKREAAILTVFIILFVLVISCIYNIIKLVINPTDAFILKDGFLVAEENVIGYIIRDEKVIETNAENKIIVPIKGEGEKVSANEAVFRFSGVNEEELQNKIKDLNLKIQQAMEGQTDLLSSDIKALKNKIEEKLEDVEQKNSVLEISEIKKEIDGYINKKSQIAGDLSPAGSYIKDLVNERIDYENQINQQAEYVKSVSSGLVSYRIDGLEDKFNTKDFSFLNINFLENLNITTGQIIPTSEKQCKIINNFECYIAIISGSEEAKNSKVGDRLTLVLSNLKETDAEIVYKKREEKQELIVIKVEQYVEELITYRKMCFDIIWWREAGLKVPKTAIFYENGLSYIVRNRNGVSEKVLVKVVAQRDDYAIIKQYTTKELKNLGYTIDEIDDIKKINRYDEIVAKPNIK